MHVHSYFITSISIFLLDLIKLDLVWQAQIKYTLESLTEIIYILLSKTTKCPI